MTEYFLSNILQVITRAVHCKLLLRCKFMSLVLDTIS